jgi:hypothetical protein
VVKGWYGVKVEDILLRAKMEAKRRFRFSLLDTCNNLWILLHASMEFVPRDVYDDKELEAVRIIIDEEYYHCLYNL